jgi:hypothetical protein
MAELSDYPAIVKGIIREHARISSNDSGIQVETIFDDEQGHYELMYAGWEGLRRVHGSVIHVDIRDGKIWIQHDGTEGGIATELTEAGVPADRIVLAFHHPYKRPYTGFAVG